VSRADVADGSATMRRVHLATHRAALRRASVAMLCVTATLAALASCSSILGLTDPVVRGEDAGPRVDADAGGRADASSADGSCGADLFRDPSHCGACDHGCLGGKCIEGRCEPARVATGFGAPYDVVGDGTHLYLGTSAGIVRLPRSDLATWEVISAADPAEAPERLARRGADLYLRRRSNVIDRCRLPGCTDPARVVAGLGLVEHLVAVDGYGGAEPIVWLDSSMEVVGVPLDDAGV